jgi:hypothetical protein
VGFTPKAGFIGARAWGDILASMVDVMDLFGLN